MRGPIADDLGRIIGIAARPLVATIGAGSANIGDVDVLSVPASDNFDPVLGKTLVRKTVDFTASQTGQTIWTPASGKKFVITDYDLSFTAAGIITVFDGTDSTTYRVFKFDGAAKGGAIHAYRKPIVSAAADNVLKYTTGAGAAGYLTVQGYEV